MDWKPEDIKQLRRDLRLGQADLATHLDVSTRSVQSWEAGTSRPQSAAQRALDRLAAQHDASSPRPLAPRLDEATATELLAEVARRLAAAERALDGALFRGASPPLSGPTTVAGGVDPRDTRHAGEPAAPDGRR